MNPETDYAVLTNGRPIPVTAIPTLDGSAFRRCILEGVEGGMRVSALFACVSHESGETGIYSVLSDDEEKSIYVGRTLVTGDSFPSIAAECPQVHLFEREIAEQSGLVPLGHPWLKPVRYHHSWTSRDAWARDRSLPIQPGSGDFYRIGGEQVHEVAVGPVHAGIIEPGHFRFQCQGEEVLHLEIALGYQHRGIEKAMEGGPGKRDIHYMETLAGDTTVGHALTYCQAVEALAGTRKSARAKALRGIALELERIANHTGDLGALANDVGYQPTASFCGRIRGDWLNLTALICGSRFGRGMVVPGGTAFDVDQPRLDALMAAVPALEKETADAVNLLWENQSVLSRFEDTGIVSRQTALDLGLVGPASRASGLVRDARFNQPSGIYNFAGIPVSTHESGDVLARAYVRWLEIRQSAAFVKSQLGALPQGPVRYPSGGLSPGTLVVAINEGWRGEICHVAITDAAGRFSRYKIVDPSFHNWMGLAMSLRNGAISDFPLCNKSFNLSYCGHDL
jgi:Ni,Fe-hydrogenase III large subunit